MIEMNVISDKIRGGVAVAWLDALARSWGKVLAASRDDLECKLRDAGLDTPHVKVGADSVTVSCKVVIGNAAPTTYTVELSYTDIIPPLVSPGLTSPSTVRFPGQKGVTGS